jgi:branched-chain amino acid aminotransferase
LTIANEKRSSSPRRLTIHHAQLTIHHAQLTIHHSQFTQDFLVDNRIYFVNGEYVESGEAGLPLNDLGIVRGYGVFDLLRTYDGVPFKLREHVVRLMRSAQAIGLEMPWTVAGLEAIARDTYRRNDLADATIRIIVTGGASANFMTPQGNPSLAVMIEPVTPNPPVEYESGVKIVSVELARFLPQVKSLNYIGAIMAMKAAGRSGAVEALYRDARGRVSECTRSNLFALRGDQLITPSDDVLAGITRAVVLEIAADQFAVREAPLHYDELLACDELFITSSTKEILPVVQVDDHTIGRGEPGPRTRQLMELFRTYVRQAGRNG